MLTNSLCVHTRAGCLLLQLRSTNSMVNIMVSWVLAVSQCLNSLLCVLVVGLEHVICLGKTQIF